VKILSFKKRVAVAVVLVVLLLFLVRPGASRLKSRIIRSLSAAVQRPVDVGSVHMRLLPRPGFDLESLVVYDDPSFSSEPILRASEVTADLRLTSLLRGRLEVARLDLTEPSLNLVHRVGGGWNLESLLERTARMPLAPTGKDRSAPRPRFPYIEGSSGRINFKNGPEKKPYALTNADFSLWQESENAWGVRLRAQPFRSDMNLNDTGLVRMDGIWQRAATVRETPLRFNVEWTRAQLGQITKFLTGNDKGWRGEVLFDAMVTGTPASVKINSTISVDDFRRYDITSGRALRLNARCDAVYEAPTHQLHEILCNALVGAGLIKLSGRVGLSGTQSYEVVMTADDVPASALGAAAQRAKKNLPDDLAVEGTLHGKFSLTKDDVAISKPLIEGHGEIADLHVSSKSENVEFGPETLPFGVTGAAVSARGGSGTGAADYTHVDFGPIAIDRRNGGASVRGWLGHSGYAFAVTGDSEAGRILRVARVLGLPSPSSNAQGTAQLNLQITGSWAGFPGAQIAGTAKLRDVHFGFRPASEPVDISSAEVQFAPDALRITKLIATAAGANWKGSMEIPRGCAKPETCPAHFALSADLITLAQLSEWEKSRSKKRPWYRVLENGPTPPSILPRIHASGRVTAERLVLHNFTASKISAMATIDAGRLQLSSLEADLFDGRHRGKWSADFSVKPASCSGSGNLTGVSLRSVSEAMKESWIEGTGSANYEIKGPCSADFWQDSEGALSTVNIINGSFPRVTLGDHASALKIQKFIGEVRLHDGTFEITDGKLNSPDARYEVTGTATLNREIDFKIVRDPPASGTYTVTGTLAKPEVAQVAGPEQARLKPPPAK
jgi:hypothetical protein